MMIGTTHTGLLCVAILLLATASANGGKHGERHTHLHKRWPSQQDAKETQEGSFQVERIRNSNHVRNGVAAKNKVFQKFHLKAGGKSGLLPRQASGSVTATPERGYVEYLCPVSIGGQTIMVDFDSGSSDFWIFSDYLNSSQTAGHTIYNSSQSSTFSLMEDSTFGVLYGDGSSATGVVGIDTVVIGGASATSAAIELPTSVTDNFVKDTDTDGIMGLGFWGINDVRPVQQHTVFDHLIPTLAQPVLSADLRETSGTYTFGAIPSDAYIGNLTTLPIAPGDGYWEFLSPFYAINGTIRYNLRNCSDSGPCTGGNAAIADTGTSLLIVDEPVAQDYYSNVPGAKNSKDAGGWIFPSDTEVSAMPSFGVSMGDHIVTVPMELMCYSYADTNGEWCYSAVQSNMGSGGSLGVQIYGDVMFRSAFVVFVNDTEYPSLLVGEKADYQ